MNILRMFRIAPALFGSMVALPVLADISSAAGDCVSNLSERTPSSAFTAFDNGSVVRHEPTGLEWQRCPLGMSWSNSACVGTAEGYSWQDAVQLAENDAEWRLPEIQELRTIVEVCRVKPSINQAVFPGTPALLFWSASISVRNPDLAWFVDFNDGYGYWGRKSYNRRVRLVRDAQ